MEKRLTKDDCGCTVAAGGGRNELGWINWVKTMCMVLIFLNHSEIYCGVLLPGRTLYLPFFVNAFFIVSGYLFFRSCGRKDGVLDVAKEKRCRMAKNIVFRIIIPSIIFSTINFFPKKILRGEPFTLYGMAHDTVLGGSLWFTNALAVAQLLLLAAVLLRVRKLEVFGAYGAVLAVLSVLIYRYGGTWASSPIPMYYKSGMCAVLLMAVGGLYWRFEGCVDGFFAGWRLFVLLFLLVGYSYVCFCHYGVYSGALDTEALNVPGIVLIVISVYCLFRICKLLPQAGFINYWGRQTIGLYFLCGALPNLFAILLRRIIPMSDVTVFICAFASLTVAVPTVYVLNGLAPWMFDLRRLNRVRNFKFKI